MSTAAAIRGIRSAARKRQRADEAKQAATDELRRYCKEAREAKVPMTEIARETGLSRQGLYDLLAERPSS